MGTNAEIRRLEQALQASAGWHIHFKRLALRRSYGIFNGNYIILCETLNRLETVEFLIPALADENDKWFQQLSLDVALVLHNFLAGAITLRDHTLAFRNEEYSDTPFGAEYDEKATEKLKNSPVVQFVQRLRNYTLHKRLPVTAAGIHLAGPNTVSGQPTAHVSLNVDKLREWGDWTAKSREYLDSLDKRIRVRIVADQYHTIIEDFYTWFAQRQADIHKSAYAEARQLQAELRAMRKQTEDS